MSRTQLCSTIALLAVAACGGDPVTPPQPPVFTHKMMKPTGENNFASLGYECPECSFDQWLAIDPPADWSKGPAQVLLADRGEIRSTPVLDGVADSVDFIEEIPGNEYRLIVKNLNAKPIAIGENGIVVEVQVMRDNWLEFNAGRRVHEMTDPEGRVFVLFAYEVDPTNVVIPDDEDPALMQPLTPPEGWTYDSRVLEAPLVLDSTDRATVLAVRGDKISTWQLR